MKGAQPHSATCEQGQLSYCFRISRLLSDGEYLHCTRRRVKRVEPFSPGTLQDTPTPPPASRGAQMCKKKKSQRRSRDENSFGGAGRAGGTPKTPLLTKQEDLILIFKEVYHKINTSTGGYF